MDIKTLAATFLTSINTNPTAIGDEFRKLPDHVHLFKMEEHQIYSETTKHYRYNCPYCPDARGKPDRDGKFYFSKEELVGYCHKCESVGISSNITNIDNALDIRLTRLRSAIRDEMQGIRIDPINYNDLFNELDEEGVEYLNSRFPLYSHLKDYFEFRVSPKTGIAVPTYINGHINSYSLRFYKPTGKMKYFIPSGDKSVYSPNKIIGNKRECTITIVEGYFDAIAALMLGEENPLACFGLYLTDNQIRIIRSILPTKIVIFLDSTSLSYKMKNNIREIFPMCSSIEVRSTYNKDPEEILKERMFYARRKGELEKFIEECVNNIRKA